MCNIGQVENGSCPVCSSKRSYRYLTLPDRFQLHEGFQYLLHGCKDCGIFFIQNKPTADLLAYFYPTTGYDPFVSKQTANTLFQKLYLKIRKFSLIYRFKKLGYPRDKNTNLLLDIGCGTGDFLELASKRGWKGTGVDFSENLVSNFKEKNIHFVLTDINDFQRFVPNENYHAITLWHSLEHTYRPKDVLKHCYTLLAKNGIIIVAVPNATGWDARIYKEYWVAYDAPRHLTMFTPETLTNLLGDCNFRVQKVSTLPLDLFYNVFLSEKLRKDIQKKVDWYFPLRMFTATLPSLMGGLAGASVIVAVGKKI
ncbi:MAG: class I SAM-dependent methyltransferase [bacterium]|nr:class I SAM-dependent methyltransferase [bacterium]